MAESAMREIVARGDRAPRPVRRGGRAPRRRGAAGRAVGDRRGQRAAPRRGVRRRARDHRRDQGRGADLEARGRGRRAPLGRGHRPGVRSPGTAGERAQVRRARAPGETQLAWEAMRELRPQIGDADEFAARIDDVQRPDGYRLFGVVRGRRDAGRRRRRIPRARDAVRGTHALRRRPLDASRAARGRGHAGGAARAPRRRGPDARLRAGCSSTRASGPSAATRTASTCATAWRSSRTTSRKRL